jgi:hypothetical protein
MNIPWVFQSSEDDLVTVCIEIDGRLPAAMARICAVGRRFTKFGGKKHEVLVIAGLLVKASY